MAGPVELVVITFQEEGTGALALEALQRLHREKTIQLFDAAVLIKNQAGKTILRETRDVDATHGAVFGAIAGAVIGLLGGPAGMVMGAAAGAATGGIAASQIDFGFSNDFLDQVKTGLQPGHSALLALVESHNVKRIGMELGHFNGELLRHILREDVVRRLAAQEDLKEDDRSKG